MFSFNFRKNIPSLATITIILLLPRISSAASSGNDIVGYIRKIYIFGVGSIGIVAAMVLMLGGLMWIMSMGNAQRVGEAKAWIGAALTGLSIALLSWLILNTINPALITSNLPDNANEYSQQANNQQEEEKEKDRIAKEEEKCKRESYGIITAATGAKVQNKCIFFCKNLGTEFTGTTRLIYSNPNITEACCSCIVDHSIH